MRFDTVRDKMVWLDVMVTGGMPDPACRFSGEFNSNPSIQDWSHLNC